VTISPPANVKREIGEAPRVVASGIDSLYLALHVRWRDRCFFDWLTSLQQAAQDEDRDMVDAIKPTDGTADWKFAINPRGVQGYASILTSAAMTWKVGHWLEPMSRPGLVVELRSEALWTHQPGPLVARVLALVEMVGGEVMDVLVSRADLCVDMLLTHETWEPLSKKNFVSRSRKGAWHWEGDATNGFSLGKGDVSARLYDKVREIKAVSEKWWMFDIWRLPRDLSGHDVIRVEFQLRREAVKQMKAGSYVDLERELPAIWRYCTDTWLRVVDDASQHHTQQHLLPWWERVQVGLKGAQEATASVRETAIQGSIDRYARMAVSALIGLEALVQPDGAIMESEELDLESTVQNLVHLVARTNITPKEFTARVEEKRAKIRRDAEKFKKIGRMPGWSLLRLRAVSNPSPPAGNKP
jgi:hypothetical protein